MIRGYQTKILKMYEEIREYEENNLRERREEIQKVIPEVLDLERKIGNLCIEVALLAFKNIEKRKEYLSNLKKEITNLRIKKTELLVAHKYPMDYLNIHYHCNKCKDTGFIGTKKCSCYYQKLVQLYYEDSDLKDLLEQNNFSNFNIEYYDTHRTSDGIDSPRQNMKKNLNIAHSFVKNFNHSNENLLFYGTSGTGKTFLSHCIAKELLDCGNLVVYRTAESLINDLREIKFNNAFNIEKLIMDCDLLIIDDLGSEPMTSSSKSDFFNFINRKLIRKKKMIISTNFSLEDILDLYSERMSSRLLGNFTICKFYGDDIRIKNNFNKIST